MPHLATIHDGSTGEPATGYSGCMAVACEPRTRQMIPLHLRMWSSEAPDFISGNHQVLEVMRTIHRAAEGRGIFVYDRGGDRDTIMLPLLEQGRHWVIRQRGDRHVLFNGKAKSEKDVSAGCPLNYIEPIVKEPREGEKVYKLEFGARTVQLPESEQPLSLVVVKGFGSEPLMLVTNVRVSKSRKSEWRCALRFLPGTSSPRPNASMVSARSATTRWPTE
jgi:hypothetical protein